MNELKKSHRHGMLKGATHRADFKIEELVEFVRAASSSEEEFQNSLASMHEALDKAAEKVEKKTPAKQNLVGQVDALIDTLYLHTVVLF